MRVEFWSEDELLAWGDLETRGDIVYGPALALGIDPAMELCAGIPYQSVLGRVSVMKTARGHDAVSLSILHAGFHLHRGMEPTILPFAAALRDHAELPQETWFQYVNEATALLKGE